MMRRNLVVPLIAVLSLAGCSGDGSVPPTTTTPGVSAPPNTTPGAPSAPVTAVSGQPPSEPSELPARTVYLVQFAREGGLAGGSESLSIQDDGAFTLTRLKPGQVRRSGRLTAEELANLRRVLRESGFTALPTAEKGHVADGYTYTITYGGYRIVAQDGAVAVPLRPLIDTLSALMSKYGR